MTDTVPELNKNTCIAQEMTMNELFGWNHALPHPQTLHLALINQTGTPFKR